MTVNELVSKELQVEPLKEGEVAVFRLSSFGKKDPNRVDFRSKEQQPIVPKEHKIAGEETIYDPYAKKSVIIRNITGWEAQKMPDGTLKEVPRYDGVTFINGVHTCTSSDFDTYAFLMRSEKREGNPFAKYAKGKKKKNVFHLVGDVTLRKESEMQVDILDECIMWLRTADAGVLKPTIMALPDSVKAKLNLDLPLDEIRRTMRKLIEDPAIAKLVMFATPGPERVIYQLKEAEKWRVIEYKESARTWQYAGVPDNEKLDQTICTTEVGEDRYMGFVNWINENVDEKDPEKGIGYENYKYIIERVKIFQR